MDNELLQEVKSVLGNVVSDLKGHVKEVMETEKKSISEEVVKQINDAKVYTDDKIKGIEVVGNAADERDNFGFDSFGDFASAVAKSAMAVRSGGSLNDEDNNRLKSIKSFAKQKDLNESIDNLGGFLVPTEFSKSLISSSIEQTNFLKDTTKIVTATNSIEIPMVNDFDRSGGYTHGGIKFYWMDEAAQHTKSNPTFKKLGLKLNKLGAMAYVTDELITDNVVALNSLLPNQFREGFVFTTDEVLFRGDGVAKPKGILNSDSLITIAKESGQAANTVVAANLLKMLVRMPMAGLSKSKWYINRDLLPVMSVLTIGNSPIFMYANSITNAPEDTLLGRPIVWTEHASQIGSVGDIVLADMSRYMTASKSGEGLKASSSMHLRFDYDQMVYKFVYRMDGQSMYDKAFKPANSQSEKSYFVTLAERA